MLNNYINLTKYLLKALKKKKILNFQLQMLNQSLRISHFLRVAPFHTVCLYTKRNRSIFQSYKMSRHKLKQFLDSRSISNVFIM